MPVALSIAVGQLSHLLPVNGVNYLNVIADATAAVSMGTSLMWSTSAVVIMPVLLASQMAQDWHGECLSMGETPVPLTSLIWSTSVVVTMPVSLASQMAQDWHGDSQPMVETQVPLTSLIWSTSAVVTMAVHYCFK